MVRSHRTTELCVAALLLTVAVGACTQPSKRLNAPPQGHTCHPSDMQAFYTPMVDQAMLSDMSMSSVHFVPHQSELNANGVRRLERYATIMKTYGGTLRYDGVDEGEQIQRDRIQRIEDYLANAGVPRDSYRVESGLAGGRGMNAEESIKIRHATFFNPADISSGGSGEGEDGGGSPGGGGSKK
jgi:uncharacterized membrane protein YgcG